MNTQNPVQLKMFEDTVEEGVIERYSKFYSSPVRGWSYLNSIKVPVYSMWHGFDAFNGQRAMVWLRTDFENRFATFDDLRLGFRLVRNK
jgi:hypothetical protein